MKPAKATLRIGKVLVSLARLDFKFFVIRVEISF
jgi:hypothetical protein